MGRLLSLLGFLVLLLVILAAEAAAAGQSVAEIVAMLEARLLKTRMASDLLSKLNFWGWQGVIVSAAATLPLGITTAKEYAELETQRAALEEATRNPQNTAEYDAYQKQVEDYNAKIRAYEEKRKLFQEKVDAFNATVKNQ